MSPDDPRVAPHLVEQLELAVLEESPLWELPLGSNTMVGPDTWRTYGPWPASACSAVLRRWFDAGWLELVAYARHDPADPPADWRTRARPDRDFLVLADDDARALLDDVDRWSLERDGLVMVVRTDAGAEHDYDEWVALC